MPKKVSPEYIISSCLNRPFSTVMGHASAELRHPTRGAVRSDRQVGRSKVGQIALGEWGSHEKTCMRCGARSRLFDRFGFGGRHEDVDQSEEAPSALMVGYLDDN